MFIGFRSHLGSFLSSAKAQISPIALQIANLVDNTLTRNGPLAGL